MKNQRTTKAAAMKALVIKSANAEDEATGNAAEIFSFQKVRNRPGTIRVSRHDARKAEKMMELLVLQNIDLSSGYENVEAAVEKAIRAEPDKYIVDAKHVGWRKNFKQFVVTDQVLGTQPLDHNVEPPLWLNQSQKTLIQRNGDFESWKKHVAKTAKFSTRLMLILSASFAAPLLSTLSMQNFGINLFGRSKVGKTAALLAGTSLIGIGKESSLPNWNMTDASFQELARVFNDQIFGVNEVGLLAGKKSDAYGNHMRANIYRFAEGRDRTRHSSSSVGASASSSTWSGIFVSTAEHSFNVYASLSGETRDEGEIARCLDVPAVIPGRPTIFDKWPTKIGKQGADAWARKKVVQLRKACERHHGVALAPYIEYLIKHKQTIASQAQEWIDEFVQSVELPAESGALQHAARNIGLVYAGGRAGIAAGCLPWDQAKLLSAIQKCFKAALRELNVNENIDRKVQSTLRKKLSGGSVVSLTQKPSSSSCDGYYTNVGGETVYTIQIKAFKSWFPNALHHHAALQWLVESENLRTNPKRQLSKGLTVSAKKTQTWEQQPRWPDKSNPRCIVFSDPFEKPKT